MVGKSTNRIGAVRMVRRLDLIDLRILGILKDEGRISTEILAERTGVDQTQCEERIFKLELDGHIGLHHHPQLPRCRHPASHGGDQDFSSGRAHRS